MELNRSVISAIGIFLVLGSVSNYCSADSTKSNAISLGGGGGVAPDATAYVFQVQYERLLTGHVALNAMVHFLHYQYDDDFHWEEGNHYGGQVDVHFYPFDEGMKWLYLGVGIGVGQSDWDWREGRDSGSGSSIICDPHVRLGSKFYLGSSGIYLDPVLQVGYWLNNEQELGFYALLLLSVGFAF
jgi:hypothetical protein